MDPETLVDVWQRLLIDPTHSWVLFEHGTCVVLPAPVGDLATQATDILRVAGPVHVGSPAADFGVLDVLAADGWVVTGDHPDVLTYVAPEELTERDDFTVGIHGRAKRHRDGTELTVVHVADRRIPQDRRPDGA
ncbi:hypothetical protein ACIRBX_03955 [Kitasatospora sp. NPDC096147]|uniref:hypothetical protein n=1 Tax=Kitasatospora sp. NPDC096147 TaxID=3364093 RepID=UPI003806C7B9